MKGRKRQAAGEAHTFKELKIQMPGRELF